MNIKLKLQTPYEYARPAGLFKYAIQSSKTGHIVSIHTYKDMADAIVNALNKGQISYFTDGYVVREIYDGETQ